MKLRVGPVLKATLSFVLLWLPAALSRFVPALSPWLYVALLALPPTVGGFLGVRLGANFRETLLAHVLAGTLFGLVGPCADTVLLYFTALVAAPPLFLAPLLDARTRATLDEPLSVWEVVAASATLAAGVWLTCQLAGGGQPRWTGLLWGAGAAGIISLLGLPLTLFGQTKLGFRLGAGGVLTGILCLAAAWFYGVL